MGHKQILSLAWGLLGLGGLFTVGAFILGTWEIASRGSSESRTSGVPLLTVFTFIGMAMMYTGGLGVTIARVVKEQEDRIKSLEQAVAHIRPDEIRLTED